MENNKNSKSGEAGAPSNGMKRILGLVPNVFFLGLVSLFNDFSAEMIIAVMPAFLTIVLGAPPVFIGFLEGFADALASVLKIFSGWFSDKIHKRKIFAVSGYSLSVFTRWILALVGNFWQVFIIRAVDRVGKGFRDAPRDALLAESVEKEEVGKSFGYQRAMDTMGAVLGPLAAVFILPLIAGDYRTLFLIAFGVGIFAVLSFIFVKESHNLETEPRREAASFSFSLKKFTMQFKLFIAAIFIFGAGVMPLSLILLKSQDIGSIGIYIPLMYLIYNISFAFFSIPFGRLSDKIGQKKVLIGGFSAAIVAYLIFAAFSDTKAIILGFIIFGLYSAMTDGVGRALASKLINHEVLASGQGFLAAAIGVSSLLAGLIGGTIWTFWGSTAAFVYGASMMLLGLLTFIRLNRFKSEL